MKMILLLESVEKTFQKIQQNQFIVGTSKSDEFSTKSLFGNFTQMEKIYWANFKKSKIL